MSSGAIEAPPLDVTFTDDPRVVREAATEDYAAHVVPRSWRAGPLSLFGAWWALASAMYWLIVAALAALTVGTRDAIIGMVAAVVVYGAISGVFSLYAARTGASVNLISRTIFGYAGGAIAPLVVAVIALYFAVFEGAVIAVGLQFYFADLGIDLSINLWYLVVVLYSVPLVFGGVRTFLDKFNGLLFPFYVIGLVAAVIWTSVVHEPGTGWLTLEPDTVAVAGPGWFWAFTVFLANCVIMMATWDYGRFGRTGKRDRRINGWVTFGPVFYVFTILVNGVAGIFIALSIPTDGPVSELSGVVGIVGLMGIWGLLFVWISQTRINTLNFYLAATNLENFVARTFKLRMPRVVWCTIVGGLVYLVMLSDVFSWLLEALRYQSVLAVTWSACVLVYIGRNALRRRGAGSFEWRPGRVPLFNWVGLLAWGTGTAVGVVMLSVDDIESWMATYAMPAGFVVSAAVQWIGMSVSSPAAGVLRRPYEVHDEVDDAWEARVRCHGCDKAYIALEMDRDPSNGHRPICASCAQASPSFYRHARAEAIAHEPE